MCKLRELSDKLTLTAENKLDMDSNKPRLVLLLAVLPGEFLAAASSGERARFFFPRDDDAG